MMSSPSPSKSSSPIATPPSPSSYCNQLKDMQLKSSMNVLKENFLRSKITKDYETLSEEIQRLQKKNEDLEFENKEFRETILYLNDEKQIIEEEKKEIEDQLSKEIKTRTEIEVKLQQMTTTNQSLQNEIESLGKEVKNSNDELDKLDKRYIKHRAIWEENERRAEDEIKRLDQFLDQVKCVLKENPEILTKCKPLEELYQKLTEINSSESISPEDDE
ncbi:sperm-associated antigen 5-like [Panonychus citri]|uniref:sperm-associated antigen 5-like n=1 Tax=Panonychus citri TaxID=50023 RepID=UPI00230752D6|nr:sperm-associated antigen 5-like [Panonychus citri]